MFGKKPSPECPDPFANKVKCEECKHWIDKIDAQEVIQRDMPNISLFLFDSGISKLYYCPKDRKPYEEHDARAKDSYYKKIEVTVEGIPVGYKKIAN